MRIPRFSAVFSKIDAISHCFHEQKVGMLQQKLQFLERNENNCSNICFEPLIKIDSIDDIIAKGLSYLSNSYNSGFIPLNSYHLLVKE